MQDSGRIILDPNIVTVTFREGGSYTVVHEYNQLYK